MIVHPTQNHKGVMARALPLGIMATRPTIGNRRARDRRALPKGHSAEMRIADPGDGALAMETDLCHHETMNGVASTMESFTLPPSTMADAPAALMPAPIPL